MSVKIEDSKVEAKVDLGEMQDQAEESVESLSAFTRKVGLIGVGFVGLAYDTLIAGTKKLLDKAEHRGEKIEHDFNAQLNRLRRGVNQEARTLRSRFDQQVESISKEVTSRSQAVERQVQKTMDMVKPGNIEKMAGDVADVKIDVDVEDLIPLPEYDSLKVEDVTARLSEMSAESLAKLRDYEASHKNRVKLLRDIDARLEGITKDAGLPTEPSA
jgi:hypothetical protein